MHSALACIHKCFKLMGHLKSVKSKCLWSSVEHMGKAVACCRKNIYAQAKIIKSLHDR